MMEEQLLSYPLPPLLTLKEEADFWARWITLTERKIFLVALWEVLSDDDKARFLNLVKTQGNRA
jgi:hypothetical protein